MEGLRQFHVFFNYHFKNMCVPQPHLEKKKMKQVCFWPSPFVHDVVVAQVAAIVWRLTGRHYDFVHFQMGLNPLPPVLNHLRLEMN